MAVCEIRDLNKTYTGEHNYIQAIVNCNMEINKGEFTVINGDRASGKSTLLRILGGLERPTNGEVYINKHNITALSDDELAIMRRNEIGFLFQNNSLISELTVHENIIMPSVLAHKKYIKEYYEEIIGRLGINDILSLYPRQLSFSQLECVTYARALINNPDIILVDEPSDNYKLDKVILDLLLNMVYLYHKTLVMVTNDPEVSIFADHIVRLQEGMIVENRKII